MPTDGLSVTPYITIQYTSYIIYHLYKMNLRNRMRHITHLFQRF